MWKWLLVIAAIPTGAAALIVLVGAMLPRDHRAAVEAVVQVPPTRVAQLVRDVEAQPRWRSGVTAVEVIERGPQGLRYVERSGTDAITIVFAEEAAGERFRSTIADLSLPFGGFWTITLAPQGQGTWIRIEERGHVGNLVYRFFSALIFGHDRTMKAYLADLRRALEP
jgi:hypothetical protein